MTIRTLLSAAACTILMAGLSPNANAQLYSYEGFDYTPGANLDGASGGQGWTGAWGAFSGSVGASAFTAVSGSLVAPVAVPSTGGSALMSGTDGTLQLSRSFNNITGSAGTTLWYSWIGQRLGEATVDPNNPYPRGVNAGLFDSENASRTERLALGNSSGAANDAWSLIPEGSGSLIEQSTTPFSTLSWAVVRIDFNGAGSPDNAYLFLNPDPNVEPAIGTADATVIGTTAQNDYAGLDLIRPFIGGFDSGNNRPFGVLAIDEIRLGGDYASMSSIVVPEPTSFALLGLAGIGLLVRRMRK